MNGYFFYPDWTSWSQRRLSDVDEPMRMMLFAEIRPTSGTRSELIPWTNVQGVQGNKASLISYLTTNEPAPTPEKNQDPDSSIGFNHKKMGKHYGMVAFLDGHVKEVPKTYVDTLNNKKVNPTLRAALGLY